MARIPLYKGPQVDSTQLPNARQSIATPDAAFGSVQVAQARQLSRGAEAGLAAGVKAFMQAKQDADQTRADEALDQMREAEIDLTFNPESGYTTLKGAQAMERPDKKPLTDEYYTKLDARRAEILQGLGNDNQRQMFTARARDRMASFRGQLMNYEGDQFQKYQVSVAEASTATASNQIARFYNDPAKVEDGVKSIRDAAAKQGKLLGWLPDQVANVAEKNVSAAHTLAITNALGQGPDGVLQAERYFQAHSGEMSLSDTISMRGKVDEAAAIVIGDLKARGVMDSLAVDAEPHDLDRAINITEESESGGRRYGADGRVLESPKGAKGEMQVMDATNTGPGFGVTPARNNSPEERARVGRDYFKALVREYKGDLASAWAAYNAGPGNVNTAKAKAIKEGHPADWMQYLPKPQETIPYVQKNLAAYRNGGGKKPAMDYEEGRKRLYADPELQARPLALKKALAAYEAQYTGYQRGVKLKQEEAFGKALEMRQSGIPMDSLPADLVAKVKPEDRTRLANYDGATDLTVYQLLANNPERVKAMSEAEFNALQADLSASDFKKFADLRGRSGSGKAGEKGHPDTLDISGISQMLKPRLQSLGLDSKVPSDQVRIGAITQHLHDRVLERQSQEGRQLTDAEMVKFIDQEFLRTRAFKHSGWFTADGVRKEQVFGMRIEDIPSATRKRLKDDLKAQGIAEPTPQQMLQAYYETDAAMPNTRR